VLPSVVLATTFRWHPFLYALRVDDRQLECFVVCRVPHRSRWLVEHVVQGNWRSAPAPSSNEQRRQLLAQYEEGCDHTAQGIAAAPAVVAASAGSSDDAMAGSTHYEEGRSADPSARHGVHGAVAARDIDDFDLKPHASQAGSTQVERADGRHSSMGRSLDVGHTANLAYSLRPTRRY